MTGTPDFYFFILFFILTCKIQLNKKYNTVFVCVYMQEDCMASVRAMDLMMTERA